MPFFGPPLPAHEDRGEAGEVGEAVLTPGWATLPRDRRPTFVYELITSVCVMEEPGLETAREKARRRVRRRGRVRVRDMDTPAALVFSGALRNTFRGVYRFVHTAKCMGHWMGRKSWTTRRGRGTERDRRRQSVES